MKKCHCTHVITAHHRTSVQSTQIIVFLIISVFRGPKNLRHNLKFLTGGVRWERERVTGGNSAGPAPETDWDGCSVGREGQQTSGPAPPALRVHGNMPCTATVNIANTISTTTTASRKIITDIFFPLYIQGQRKRENKWGAQSQRQKEREWLSTEQLYLPQRPLNENKKCKENV